MTYRLLAALIAVSLLLSGCRGAAKTPSKSTAAPGTATAGLSPSGTDAEVPALFALDGEEDAATGLTLSATEVNENVVRLTNGAVLQLAESDLNKLGDAPYDGSAPVGGNACISVGSGSVLTASDTSVTTAATLAPALTVTGEGSAATLSNVIMATSGDTSPLIEAFDAGVVNLFHATLMAERANSPCFSIGSAAVSAESGSIRASGDAIARLTDGARLTLVNADLSGWTGFVFHMNTGKEASAAITGGYLAVLGDAPCFELMSGSAVVRMENVTVTGAPETLIFAENGTFSLSCVNQQLTGAILSGENAAVSLALTEGSRYAGAFPAEGAPFVSLSLDATSCWQVTAESVLSVLTAPDTAFLGIESNGFNVYYDSSRVENVMLGAKSYLLPGGGFLIPMI